MSANKWDKWAVSDVPVSTFSPSKFDAVRPLFIVHTDLDINDGADVIQLHLAMIDPLVFRIVVPDFLGRWRKPDTGDKLEALDFLAGKIRAGSITNCRVWRFAVVPSSKPSEPPALEIQLMVYPLRVLPVGADRKATFAGLQSTVANQDFFTALDFLRKGLNGRARVKSFPGAAKFLDLVFVRP